MVIHLTMLRIVRMMGLNPEELDTDRMVEITASGLGTPDPEERQFFAEAFPFLRCMDSELLAQAYTVNVRLLEEMDPDLTVNSEWDVACRFLVNRCNADLLEYIQMLIQRLDRYAVAIMVSHLSGGANDDDWPFRADEVFAKCIHRHNWRLVPRYTRPWEIVLIEKDGDNRPSLQPYWKQLKEGSPEDHNEHPQTSYATRQVVWVDAVELGTRMSVRQLVGLLHEEGISPFQSNLKLVIPAEVAAQHGEVGDLDLLGNDNDLSLDLWYITVDTDAVLELCSKIHRIHHETDGSCGATRLALAVEDSEPTSWIVSNDIIELRLADAAFLDAGGTQ